jgi:hypothetical protein
VSQAAQLFELERSSQTKMKAWGTNAHVSRCGNERGFAYVPREDQILAPRGIISSAPKEDEPQTDFRISGRSTIVGVCNGVGHEEPDQISENVAFALLPRDQECGATTECIEK